MNLAKHSEKELPQCQRRGEYNPPLVQGGQGRSNDEVDREAAVVLCATVILASVLAVSLAIAMMVW